MRSCVGSTDENSWVLPVLRAQPPRFVIITAEGCGKAREEAVLERDVEEDVERGGPSLAGNIADEPSDVCLESRIGDALNGHATEVEECRRTRPATFFDPGRHACPRCGIAQGAEPLL